MRTTPQSMFMQRVRKIRVQESLLAYKDITPLELEQAFTKHQLDKDPDVVILKANLEKVKKDGYRKPVMKLSKR